MTNAASPDGSQDVDWRDLTKLAQEFGGEYARPEHVAEFFAGYAALLKPKKILDPFATTPVIAAAIAEQLPDSAITAVTPNERAAELGQSIAPTVDWRVGDPISLIPGLGKFDLIASSPPIGLATRALPDNLVDAPPAGVWKTDVAHLVMCLSASHLERAGSVAFMLGEGSIFSRSGLLLREYMAQRFGLMLDASVSFSGGLAPISSITTQVSVYTEQKRPGLFIARIASGSDQESILANLVAHEAGPEMEVGEIVELAHYRGWASARAERDLELALPGDVPTAKLGSMVTSIEGMRLLREDADPVFANTLFLPEVGFGPARLRVFWGDKTSKSRSVVAVHLDPECADAEFVADWLNGSTGKLARQSVATGAAQPRISRGDLESLLIPLPPLDVQRRSIELKRRVTGLRAELEALGARIVQEPSLGALDGAEQELRGLLRGDDVEAWTERIPFPVASILMRYVADAEERDKHDRLLWFFEAMAALMATLLLSAARADDERWATARSKLAKEAPDGSYPLKRASFGSWVQIGRTLAKLFRRELGEDAARDTPAAGDLRRQAIGVADRGFYVALTNRETWELLASANEARNRQKGHGGVVSARQLKGQVGELEQLVGDLREEVGSAFDGVSLVQPGECAYDGGVFRFRKAKRLMGSNPAFKERTLASTQPLHADGLFLLDRADLVESALDVIPLFRLRPSPDTEENACYFFNRVDPDGDLRYVSYHLAGAPDAAVGDVDVTALIADLQGPIA